MPLPRDYNNRIKLFFSIFHTQLTLDLCEISGIYIFNLHMHDRSYSKSNAMVKSMRAYAETLGLYECRITSDGLPIV
jgi:hypothetical protein